MKRCSTRCEPNAPSPQPAVEMTNTAVIISFPAPVNGLRNPAGCPSPLNGEVVVKMSVSGRMMKHESITIDWKTSVRETAMKPLMNVYDVTAASVISTPMVCSRPKIVPSSFVPPISPELT